MTILLLMIFVMPFEINPYLYLSRSFLGIIPEFTVIKALGMVGLFWVCLVSGLGGRRLGLLKSLQAKWFAIYVFASAFSGLLSGAMIQPVTRLLAVTCLLPLVLAVVRNEKDLKRVLTVAGAVLVFVFPYAYRQVLRFGGRLGVGLYEPNYLAAAIVLLLPLSLVFARHAETRSRRRRWYIGTAVLTTALVLTGSRGGFVGLVVVIGLLSLMFMRKKLLGLVTFALIFGTLLVVVPNPLARRLLASGIDGSVQDSAVNASNSARWSLILGGLRMIAERPLVGVGIGQFKARMGEYNDLETDGVAHNTYLHIAAEQGLPTLGAYLGTFFAALMSLRRTARLARGIGRQDLMDIATALFVGMVGFSVSATFLSAQYEKFYWLIFCLSISAERIVRQIASQSDAVEVLSRPRATRGNLASVGA